jgi:hypothetical protein
MAGRNIGRSPYIQKSDVINEIRMKLKQDMQRIAAKALANARELERARLAAWQFKYGYRGKLWQSDTTPATLPGSQPSQPSQRPQSGPGVTVTLLAQREYKFTCAGGFRWVGNWTGNVPAEVRRWAEGLMRGQFGR